MSEIINALYVEDNPADAELMGLCIERYMNVDSLFMDIAGTVAQAKDMFSVEKYSAVLIDWNLSDGNGIEVAEHIRKHSSDTKIIFISSAEFTEAQKLKCQQYDVKAFMLKEYNQGHIEKIRQLFQTGHIELSI
jgi:DNA-binding response OmpR family regulator